jgi:hypothetical protein
VGSAGIDVVQFCMIALLILNIQCAKLNAHFANGHNCQLSSEKNFCITEH